MTATPGEMRPDGTQLIAAERWRQITAEGWTPEHDDEHRSFELVKAAESYLIAITHGYTPEVIPQGWPWDAEWWKPTGDPVRNLVKAGALIAAEIDRLQRRGGKGSDAE